MIQIKLYQNEKNKKDEKKDKISTCGLDSFMNRQKMVYESHVDQGVFPAYVDKGWCVELPQFGFLVATEAMGRSENRGMWSDSAVK